MAIIPSSSLREIQTNVAYTLNNPNVNAGCVPSRSNSARVSIDATRTTRDVSPRADRRNRGIPTQCPEMIREITNMFFEKERTHLRDSTYLTARQTEVTEKMRAIVVDWLIDVAIKFRNRPETFYLAVDIMDRYLSVCSTTRAQLQLVGITSLLIAAKHEEMWAPDVRECIKITANTYDRESILSMERNICTALCFRFTVPTAHPFLERLLQVSNADHVTRCAAYYFLEHAMMNYGMLTYLPSTVAASAMYLANVLLQRFPHWPRDLEYYSRARVGDIRPCASVLLRYAHHVAGARYQAVRRKYSSAKYCEITQIALPADLPLVE